MTLILNGSSYTTLARTLDALVLELDLEADSVATAVNGSFVPAAQRSSFVLHEGCDIEVLSPMQGG